MATGVTPVPGWGSHRLSCWERGGQPGGPGAHAVPEAVWEEPPCPHCLFMGCSRAVGAAQSHTVLPAQPRRNSQCTPASQMCEQRSRAGPVPLGVLACPTYRPWPYERSDPLAQQDTQARFSTYPLGIRAPAQQRASPVNKGDPSCKE